MSLLCDDLMIKILLYLFPLGNFSAREHGNLLLISKYFYRLISSKKFTRALIYDPKFILTDKLPLFDKETRLLNKGLCNCLKLKNVGTEGFCYKICFRSEPQQVFALKKAKLIKDSEEGISYYMLRELSFLSFHDAYKNYTNDGNGSGNVSGLHDVYKYNYFKENLHVTFNYSETSLEDILVLTKRLSERVSLEISWQILRGLDFCHSIAGVAHRNIKPKHILLNIDIDISGADIEQKLHDALVRNTSCVKISDFAFCRPNLFPNQDIAQAPCLTQQVFSLNYRSPELLREMIIGQKGRYGTQPDVWALGCVLAQMLVGQHIFPGKTESLVLFEQNKLLGLDRHVEQDSSHTIKINPLAERQRDSTQLFNTFLPKTNEDVCAKLFNAKFTSKQISASMDTILFLKWIFTVSPAARPSASELLLSHIFSKKQTEDDEPSAKRSKKAQQPQQSFPMSKKIAFHIHEELSIMEIGESMKFKNLDRVRRIESLDIMLSLAKMFGISIGSIAKAINLFDYFILKSENAPTTQDLDLVAVVCLYLSSKHTDLSYVGMIDLAAALGAKETAKLKTLQQEILVTVNFNLWYPTSFDYLKILQSEFESIIVRSDNKLWDWYVTWNTPGFVATLDLIRSLANGSELGKARNYELAFFSFLFNFCWVYVKSRIISQPNPDLMKQKSIMKSWLSSMNFNSPRFIEDSEQLMNNLNTQSRGSYSRRILEVAEMFSEYSFSSHFTSAARLWDLVP